jgi:starch-binding outer membrane protein, SusD/RagB family
MRLFKYIAGAALGVAVLGACSKQLDLLPTDSINENNAFLTINDAQQGANAAYSRYNAFQNDIFVSSLMSDEAKLGVDNSGQGAIPYRYQLSATSGDVNGGYAGYYGMIDQTNRVLQALPNVKANTPFEETRRPILRGQMLALRAIGYFGLLQSFCKNYDPSAKGVPIMLAPNPAAKPPHNTMGEVMSRIETDLADAFALLPAVTVATFSDTVMNRVNIDAYRAKIALYKGDFANAITYATNVINSAVKPLVTGAAFTSIWTESGTTIPESLFRIRNATGTGLGGFWTTTTGLVYIAPSDKVTDIYTSTIPGTQLDIRRGAYIGLLSGKPYVKKHESNRSPNPGNRVVDLKCIRMAEMYLIRAEAYARQSTPNLAGGTADLNTLRSNRITGYTNVANFTTASALLTAVLEERYKELCFEGSRFFDLKRNGLPVNRWATDVTAPTWQNLPASSDYFVMPIPQQEILANPNAVQNPGY